MKKKYEYKPAIKAEDESYRFGRLTAVSYRETDIITLWDCICSCGNRRVVEERRLFDGKVTCCIICEFNNR